MFRRNEPGATLSARGVVGMAHLAVGALSLLNVFAALGFSSGPPGAVGSMAVGAALLGVAVALVFSGLWIGDGKRRGAFLSIGLNGFRVAFFLIVTHQFNVDVVLALAMLGAAVWLLPTLEK